MELIIFLLWVGALMRPTRADGREVLGDKDGGSLWVSSTSLLVVRVRGFLE